MIAPRRWLPLLLLVGLVSGGALVRLQDHLDRALAGYRTEAQFLYLSSGDWVKRLSLGYDGLLACVYWTRAVQHYGRERLAEGEFTLLYPLLDITTTLDPDLILAYRFGALFLTENLPGGPGRPDQAVRLLEKGINQHPDYWRFWYDLGFVYYRGLKDYEKAADAFETGARHPQAAPWMTIMAAKVRAEGASRASARFLWQQLYQSTDDPTIRQAALYHLYGIQVDEEIEVLQRVVRRFEEQAGRRPYSWQELIAAGYLRGIPADPTGWPYELTPEGNIYLHPRTRIGTSELGKRPVRRQ